ncbi:MAG: homoserine dehydrogenase [Planctomycetota bacterium]|jgi:homoserine dehydrogenase|nr:homoserine dehydrogenase [Blastopirellula sp.]
MDKTFVGLVGMGNVGAGVARLLLDHGDRTARHAGRILWIRHVVVRDVLKPRPVELPSGVLTDDLDRLLNDSSVSVVAHLVGGIEPARTIMLRLLESGKDVVTANKALLAEHGPELFDRARELGRSIAFEASVAGGIPIIANISQCLNANRVESLRGILNGTSNYIITRMSEEGTPFSDALAAAQRLGFAEADPAMDLDGTDAAQKLAILGHLAFGSAVHWNQIPRRGIDDVSALDLSFAAQFGYRVKLVAYGQLEGRSLQVRVAPMLVRAGTPLAEVRENYNAISVVGDFVGPVFFHGQGAGPAPTASAVVADMIDTAVGRTRITFQTLRLWSEIESPVVIESAGRLAAKFYLRFNVVEHPTVLADVAGVLNRHGISIATVYQQDLEEDPEAELPLVLMTHRTTLAAVESAAEEITRFEFVRSAVERLQILD